ncbi:MAG: hypothetical protein ABI359_05590 [Ginsengibacter sp.]
MYNFLLILLIMIAGATSHKYDIHFEKHPGTLILNNGQIIKGDFKYATWEFPSGNFKYYSNAGKVIKRYKESQIKSITLAGSDTTLSKKDSTYIMVIGKLSFFTSSLYRQLTFGPIKIYDQLINVNERRGLVYSDLAVLENNKLRFYSKRKFLKYIENKLKEKNIEKSFKSTKEAIRYLNFAQLIMSDNK